MEDAYYNFEAFTGFIIKDDKRGSSFKFELKGDKDVGDNKKKGGKIFGKKKKFTVFLFNLKFN